MHSAVPIYCEPAPLNVALLLFIEEGTIKEFWRFKLTFIFQHRAQATSKSILSKSICQQFFKLYVYYLVAVGHSFIYSQLVYEPHFGTLILLIYEFQFLNFILAQNGLIFSCFHGPPPPNFGRSINPNLIQFLFFHPIGYKNQ